ncbi:MAG: 4-hydroxy-tetrahydrodipicolinate reductase [Chlorobi bacterium]|nr:4-hydroxy-tetrahydrodipicolinate reductase [Chlorobiota bacterium]
MNPLRLVLLGYGRMGAAIETVATERGHVIVLRVRSSEPVKCDTLHQADVALDFSRADAVLDHVALCAAAGVPLVIGTTGWRDDTATLEHAAERIGIIVGANFSIGVAVVVRLAALLAEYATPGLGYQLHVHEVHHRAKRDAPSGTALLLARTLAQHSPTHRPIVTESEPPIAPDAITLSAARVGTVVGTHTVTADSEADTIEISHAAKSRRGFALGAVLAAEWIVGRRGMYHFADHAFDIVAMASVR